MKKLQSGNFFSQFPGILFILLVAGLTFLVNPVMAEQHNKLSDADITVAVENELEYDEGVQSHLIDVETHNGVVTLSGTVNNILAKDRAEKLAETIKGVRAVVNNIEVVPVHRTDEQIELDIKEAFLRDPAAESYEIDAEVEDARVTLTGTVESWAEKNLAEQVAKGVKGIKELENEIVIEYTEDRTDYEITNEIRKRLEASVWVDDGLIDVTTQDGNVNLSGTVGSASEKTRAYTLAWIAGVKSVNDDNLQVKWWARDDMRRESKYALKTDEEIKEAVKDALLWDPRVSSFKPAVKVENGVVTLRGSVDNYEAKQAAERDAENTMGVVHVDNRLKVRPSIVITDKDITQKVENAFLVDPVLEQFELNVNTINRKVYLYGRVNSLYEKNRAEDVASRQRGVAEVENKIKVDYVWEAKSDMEIKNDVEDQLFWSLAVDDDEITVAVDNGVVTLSGMVDDKQEENAAIKNAFDGGAKQVENNLDVKHDYDWIEKGRTYEWLDYKPYRYWPYYPW